MFVTHQISVLLSTMTLTVALFGVAYCLTQRRDRQVFQVLSLFLTAEAFTVLGVSLSPAFTGLQVKLILHAFWLVGVASVAPLLWLYVCSLTSPVPLRVAGLKWHATLPLIGGLAFVWILFLPAEARLGLLPDPDRIQGSQDYFTGRTYELVFLIVPFQWVFYLIAITRRLLRYRSRLKDFFASTEQREMRWISVVVLLYSGYWAINIGSLIYELATWKLGLPQVIEAFYGLILISVIALWGLRQRRPIDRDTPAPETRTPRYSKSALTKDMSQKIAGQLRNAMAREALYLDPNLSLWSLAKHIQVPSKYVTQVLNEEIGESFFDFVSRHRIEAAVARLDNDDATILSIAYDVGFNSRSSFYSAFKKVMSMTPTAYRKANR